MALLRHCLWRVRERHNDRDPLEAGIETPDPAHSTRLTEEAHRPMNPLEWPPEFRLDTEARSR